MAAGSALGAAMFVPAVWKVAGLGAKVAWHGAIKPAAMVAGLGLGVGAAGIGAGAYAAVGTATGRSISGYAARVAGRSVLRGARTVIGGTAHGGFKAASWIYNHPGLSMAGAAVGGMGLAMGENATPGNRTYGSGMVDLMGGTSNYGISEMMSNMNASGNIVLGANNRRR